MQHAVSHVQSALDDVVTENKQVNDHPEPTADLAKIKEELGLQALRFKKYDNDAHKAANAIGAAAEAKDMKEISRQYGKMIKSCTKCHEAFRDRLRVVLHQ